MSPSASNPPTDPAACAFLASPLPENPEAAFRELPAAGEFRMAQDWETEPSPRFRPARVRIGWNDGHLVVGAEMEDGDIFNPAAKTGDRTWMLGDVFEIFITHESLGCYYEFHVTPSNHRLALRFPDNWKQLQEAARPAPFSPFLYALDENAFFSTAAQDASRERWWVQVRLPWTLLLPPGVVPKDCRFWKFSFSRYDYTRGVKRPVCSSTSAHTRLDFHEKSAWRTLELVSSDLG
jgi:hypothetical protein